MKELVSIVLFFFISSVYAQESTDTPKFIFFDEIVINNITSNNFILDTGANISIIDSSFFKTIPAEKIGSTINTDILQNKKKKNTYLIKELKIGKHVFHNLRVITANLKEFFPCTNIDGIIGTNLLKECIAEVDLSLKKVKILDFFTDEENRYEKIKLQIRQNLPYLKVHIGKSSFKCLFDSGNLNDIDLTFNDYNKIKRNFNVKVKNFNNLTSSINNKKLTHYSFSAMIIPKIKIEKITVKNPVLLFNEVKNRIVGLGMFEKGKMIIDMKNRRLFLNQNNIFLKHNYDNMDNFLGARKNKNAIIISTMSDSLYFKKLYDLKLGDTIQQVNSLDFNTKPEITCDDIEYINKEFDKKSFKMKISRWKTSKTIQR